MILIDHVRRVICNAMRPSGEGVRGEARGCCDSRGASNFLVWMGTGNSKAARLSTSEEAESNLSRPNQLALKNRNYNIYEN
jgi:hypothetical protein